MDYEASIEIDDDVVKEYVRDNYSVDDVYPDGEIFDYVREKEVDDIFSPDTIHDWAITHGYVKEE